MAVLATHFGRREKDKEDQRRSTRLMYSGFGAGLLSWESVHSDPTNIITQVCKRNAEECRLRFSNHRKYETPKLGPKSGIDVVLGSYVLGVQACSNKKQVTFFSTPEEIAEERFERLMGDLRFIWRFGRTAKFDLLCLLGNLGVYELRPGRIYLKGATGPLKGARAMFGSGEITYLEHRANEMARILEVSIQVVEDALCNWQKHRRLVDEST